MTGDVFLLYLLGNKRHIFRLVCIFSFLFVAVDCSPDFVNRESIVLTKALEQESGLDKIGWFSLSPDLTPS